MSEHPDYCAERARFEMTAETPEVRVNQFWVAYGKNGEVMRRIRILALHPDGGWIYEDAPARMTIDLSRLGRVPEFNLRYVFRLEEDGSN